MRKFIGLSCLMLVVSATCFSSPSFATDFLDILEAGHNQETVTEDFRVGGGLFDNNVEQDTFMAADGDGNVYLLWDIDEPFQVMEAKDIIKISTDGVSTHFAQIIENAPGIHKLHGLSFDSNGNLLVAIQTSTVDTENVFAVVKVDGFPTKGISGDDPVIADLQEQIDLLTATVDENRALLGELPQLKKQLEELAAA